MRARYSLSAFLCLIVMALLPLGYISVPSRAMADNPVHLAGLRGPVRVVRDSNYIPHIYAKNDHDAYFMQGYIQARDRFFQMDMQRRLISGTLAELVGTSALRSDVRFRTYGLRRAAEASLKVYTPEARAIFDAYAAGVNAYLAEIKKDKTLMPPEYEALELTTASIPDWTALDTVIIGKGLAFQFSFDPIDINLTKMLFVYEQAGKEHGFDGQKFFYEDVFRINPFDPSITKPAGENSPSVPNPAKPDSSGLKTRARSPRRDSKLSAIARAETLKLASKYLASVDQTPFLREFLKSEESPVGSNWWVVSGKHTASGYPLLANDPHLSLHAPAVFYELHLTVESDSKPAPMNVNGLSVPGIPGVLVGCNDRLCWGAAVNPMDVTDVYQEQLVEDSKTIYGATIFEGKEEKLVVIEQKYMVNKLSDKQLDNMIPGNVAPAEGGLTWIVPRRNNGPIVETERHGKTTYGLSVQYLGWGPTRELEAFHRWARASTIEDFKQGLEFYEVGSQNWVVADVKGNIAYFTGGKVPLREDLETLGRADGDTPPFIVRDGTHKLKHEWLRTTTSKPGQVIQYQTLPFEEMPQVVNPRQGFIANANNDPIGATIDNNAMNQFRKTGGVYYLDRAYYTGLRMGRILRLLQADISKGKKLSLQDMMKIQADNKLTDAESLTSHILKAFNNARNANAPPALAALGADPAVAEAVGRLRAWDFSAPTGILQGYDAGDDPDKLAEPSAKEVQSSVSATIYSVWRSRIVDNIIDATLRRVGVGNFRPGTGTLMTALRHWLENFSIHRGRGASGANFFEVKEAPSPEAARDIIILRSVKEALDLLAGDSFNAAFKKSTNQNDYRWGRLHRTLLDHRLGLRFNIPEAGGFSHLSPDLRGIARPGGFESLDGSAHNVRATGANGFMHTAGAVNRFVGELRPDGPRAFQIIAGGQSGDAGSKFYANMLGRWLTNQYHPMLLTRKQVNSDAISEQSFLPAR